MITRQYLAAVAAAFTVACTTNTFLESRTIGPAGGVIQVSSGDNGGLGGLSITVPAGALAQQVTITVEASALGVARSGEVAAGPVAEIQPEGTLFAVPVIITLPVAIPAGQSPAALAIEAVESSGDGRLIPVGSEAGGFATFQTTSFTRFGAVIVLAQDGGAVCLQDSDCSCAQCLDGECKSVVCNCPEVTGCTEPGPGPCCCPVACDGGAGPTCAANSDCSPTQYCAKTSCGGRGFCMNRPQVCPQYCTSPEICGCDGNQYCNVCIANSAGINASADGSACGLVDAGPAPCTSNTSCSAIEFCATSSCGGTGTCAQRPQVCPAICASPELCGCDGRPYCSECAANAAGVNVSRDGAACGTGLEWYTTCGYPVCPAGLDGGDDWPDGGPCPAVGSACGVAGATCGVPSDSNCGVIEVCAQTDPKGGPGGCPISSRRFKQGIDYLDESALEALHGQLLRTRLAAFRYAPPYGDPAAPHIGFIIEDQPDSPAVDGLHSRVDLYNYLGMVVATTQVQEKEIRALRAEVQAAHRPSGLGSGRGGRHLGEKAKAH